MPRLSYEESCQKLIGWIDEGPVPPIPDHIPRHDDEEPLCVSFFRTFVGEREDLSNLTIPRTFFGRSEINEASFRNTDLSESNLCWNDFTDVDFSNATLANSDMRASVFCRVSFVSADLRKADLRRSSFEECSFRNANMAGAIMTRDQQSTLRLSIKQRLQIAWTTDEGPEPDGG